MSEYPKREPMYALRYVKWLSYSDAAREIGPDAFALLTAVAIVEDDIRYHRAPTFYNDQLARACGIGSEPALIRARKRAIEAGLLVYVPGAKRRPGRYFTYGFPNESLAKAKLSVSESEALHSYPSPIPLIDSGLTDESVPNSDPILVAFAEFWKAYPPRDGRKLNKSDAEAAFKKLKPEDYPLVMAAVRNLAASTQSPKDAFRFLRKDKYGKYPWREWLEPASTKPDVSNRPEHKPFPSNGGAKQ